MPSQDHGPVPSNKLAFCWDADGTLLPGYMQTPLFEHFGVNERDFWAEVNAISHWYTRTRTPHDPDNIYLQWILEYARPGNPFHGLTNQLLRDLARDVALYPGVEELMLSLTDVSADPKWAAAEIQVEHYVISTGLRQMILGTPIATLARGVWGGEFAPTTGALFRPGFLREFPALSPDAPLHEQYDAFNTLIAPLLADSNQPIGQVAYSVSATQKTQILYGINKGANIDPEIDVDRPVPDMYRRVPWHNITYTGDSKTDIPAMSVTLRNGGSTLAVFAPGSAARESQARALVTDGRAQAAEAADFSTNSELWKRLHELRNLAADRIVEARSQHRARYHGTQITHHQDGLQTQARRSDGRGIG